MALTADGTGLIVLLVIAWLVVFTAVRVAVPLNEPHPAFGAVAEPSPGGVRVELHLLTPTVIHDVTVRWVVPGAPGIVGADVMLPARPLSFEAPNDDNLARHARWLEVAWIPDGEELHRAKRVTVPVIVPARAGAA